MNGLIERRGNTRSTRIRLVPAGGRKLADRELGASGSRWLRETGFEATAGEYALVPGRDGSLRSVVAAADPADPLWCLAGLPHALPVGNYQLDALEVLPRAELAALGWALEAYRFTRYRKRKRAPARLALPRAELGALRPLVEAVALVRDLVNTPTSDLGPAELAAQVQALATVHGATLRESVGADLLKHGYPTIHAVGRAAGSAPRFVELSWGNPAHPRVALVGKGVCFDSGGLDLKTATGMRWMKKDMGGAAHAIALAGLVMGARLPVRLSLLVPAVENAVAGDAYRPGEIITTRAGIRVEVDNTDAEGRLVLCDALARAVELEPDLVIDFATLTGAARVALGPELPALFCNDEALAGAALQAAAETCDPLWRLPLWQPYRRMLKSHVADTLNSATTGQAGAITAALYLQRFVPAAIPWLHLDVYAWNDTSRPGRPRGGEAMGLRACFELLRRRYG